MNFIKANIKAIGIGAGVLLVLLILFGSKLGAGGGSQSGGELSEADAAKQEALENIAKYQNDGSEDSAATDKVLMSSQKNLEAKYGKAPDGFIWDMTGNPISLGDKSLEPEEVAFGYLQAVSKLDFGIASFYSRTSNVTETYEAFFDESMQLADYNEDFLRNMYKLGLTSLQVTGVETASTFAKDKIVYTIQGKILDLTDKDFWLEDRKELFENLYLYEKGETDTVKAETYLYDYLLDYYGSGDAKLKDISFDITVQKYPDLDSGWLVSIDKDLDTALKYTDGTLVVQHIMNEYQKYKLDQVVGRE